MTNYRAIYVMNELYLAQANPENDNDDFWAGISIQLPSGWTDLAELLTYEANRPRTAGDLIAPAELPRTKNNDSLALDGDEVLLFHVFEYTSYHLARAADDATEFLAGDANLHAVGMRHGVGFLG